ncbi:AMP-binding protein [Mycobacterium sp.]|uniref:AMP-binding protein n=1 Tax=Mycobacterium sp. TaxID=1785 RepID=UPI003A86D3DD
MSTPGSHTRQRIKLSRSQRNIYNGARQDGDPGLYLIGKRYRFHPLEPVRFLTALAATIRGNPVQLCVLDSSPENDYPDLVERLNFGDLVRLQTSECHTPEDPAGELSTQWESGILGAPLVRYTVWTDPRGAVTGMDVHAHHILLDGGATAIIEDDLARHLANGGDNEERSVTDGLARLAAAHGREAARVDEALRRFTPAVRAELTEQSGGRGIGGGERTPAPGTAARGVPKGSARIRGDAYHALRRLCESSRLPLHALVTAAAVAVDAAARQDTEVLVVHPVDNRFGEPDLNVATCLVNSVAHTFGFPPFASVADVATALDRGYVKAVRRRWFREERYRRMYLAINRTSHVEALTVNFVRQPCAAALRELLAEAPEATHIGPVEGTTVACVQDDADGHLTVAIWDRADLPPEDSHSETAARIAAARIAGALEAMPALWNNPIAMTVGEWFGIDADGARRTADDARRTARDATAIPAAPASSAPAWFADPAAEVRAFLNRRHYVGPWLARLAEIGATPGEVLVFVDDGTDRAVDLMIACHLAGCGYSVCERTDEPATRAQAITAGTQGPGARVIDATVPLTRQPDDGYGSPVDCRIAGLAADPGLAARTAYVMPTSGTTGTPKLVEVTHGSLALFCAAAVRTYRWGPHDRILQCAPLTSDISVEEIFGAAFSGSALVRSPALKARDVTSVAADAVTAQATVLDLPTAVWQLWCDDRDVLEKLHRSHLRQIVIGGEPIRPGAVDKWLQSATSQHVSLISSYGPTEATVVATTVPVTETGAAGEAHRRVGRPIVSDTVFTAFGEVVIVGDLVSTGYVGLDGSAFGTVVAADGSRLRAFATADRTTLDSHGFPVFAGRRDAVVKIAGKRVDTAEVTARIAQDAAVRDVAVAAHQGCLRVWFQTARTRDTGSDPAAAARIGAILAGCAVPSFSVTSARSIPRKPNGKVDGDRLHQMPAATTTATAPATATAPDDTSATAVTATAENDGLATGLAEIWSRILGRVLRPDSSLLDEGIGSVDLIRILPDTRKYLDREHLSILDLISADGAANLIADVGRDPDPTDAQSRLDARTVAEIRHDLESLTGHHQPAASGPTRVDGTLLILGASGILGTGFARALQDACRDATAGPAPAADREVVLATRSPLPRTQPWQSLRRTAGVRIVQLPPGFDDTGLDALIRDTRATTVVNCIGTTDVLVPYRQLRRANVELVATIVGACARYGSHLVHLSSFVVGSEVTALRVIDPRCAPYPYAASKSMAELIVAASPAGFTIVRLPRVLGEPHQIPGSADVFVSVADSCIAVGAYPSLELTEEITTGSAAATAILGGLPSRTGGPARAMTVLHGEQVGYAEFLGGYGLAEIDAADWKKRLDASSWARQNPRRWSVVDGWFGLGMRLGSRSYAQYLTDFPAVELTADIGPPIIARPAHLRDLLSHRSVGVGSPEVAQPQTV